MNDSERPVSPAPPLSVLELVLIGSMVLLQTTIVAAIAALS